MFSFNPLHNPIRFDIVIFIPILRMKSQRFKRDWVTCPAADWSGNPQPEPSQLDCTAKFSAGEQGSKNKTHLHNWGLNSLLFWSLFLKYSGKHRGIFLLVRCKSEVQVRTRNCIRTDVTQFSSSLLSILKLQMYHTRTPKVWFKSWLCGF